MDREKESILRDIERSVKPTLYRKTKWLLFVIVDHKPKTLVLHVYNTSDQFLGIINWGTWRQYVYQPNPAELTFNNQCLQDIADVLTDLNDAHKKGNEKKTRK